MRDSKNARILLASERDFMHSNLKKIEGESKKIIEELNGYKQSEARLRSECDSKESELQSVKEKLNDISYISRAKYLEIDRLKRENCKKVISFIRAKRQLY